MEKNKIYSEFLDYGNWIPINKLVLKKFGLPDALMVGFLFQEYNIWANEGKLQKIDGKDYFFCTRSYTEEKTGLLKDTQSRILSKMIDQGILDVKKYGTHAKRHIHINIERLHEFLFDDVDVSKCDSKVEVSKIDQTRSQKTTGVVSKNDHTLYNNNQINNNQINNNQIYRQNEKFNLEQAITNYTLNEDVREALRAFFEVREAKKVKATERAVKMIFNKLDKLAMLDDELKVEILNQSTIGGWAGIFPYRGDGKQANGYSRDRSADFIAKMEAYDKVITERGGI